MPLPPLFAAGREEILDTKSWMRDVRRSDLGLEILEKTIGNS